MYLNVVYAFMRKDREKHKEKFKVFKKLYATVKYKKEHFRRTHLICRLKKESEDFKTVNLWREMFSKNM